MKTLEKRRATTLRNRGLSYQEIRQRIPVSSGSLSRWLRDIELNEAQQARIYQKNFLIRRKFAEYAKRKCERSKLEKNEVIGQCAREIGALTRRELHIVGTALYWAEGSKGTLTSVVEFVNTDPAMIGLMMRWFRECCNVSEQKFRVRVQLHEAVQRQHIEQYWSKVTGIPMQQFTKPILKLSPSSQRKRGNPLPYGTLHLRIADVHLLTRIQGWMKGLALAPSSSPA